MAGTTVVELVMSQLVDQHSKHRPVMYARIHWSAQRLVEEIAGCPAV
ncbi:hypothetical protein BLA29_015307 [Euroglyphus maynei]|uniref:Uncharacterized protein n=1 Tax=Euroglyphus maynei TaxID=6958 RepID=A0A1Y3AWP0_EURMA|nr:hypothetical protein BLA29_015307 [Euroglyphus maynei]